MVDFRSTKRYWEKFLQLEKETFGEPRFVSSENSKLVALSIARLEKLSREMCSLLFDITSEFESIKCASFGDTTNKINNFCSIDSVMDNFISQNISSHLKWKNINNIAFSYYDKNDALLTLFKKPYSSQFTISMKPFLLTNLKTHLYGFYETLMRMHRNLPDNIVIAGGFVAFLLGITNCFGDIDIYVFESENNSHIIRRIIAGDRSWRGHVPSIKRKLHVYSHKTYNYQIIFKKSYGELENDVNILLSDFDLSLCRNAITLDGKVFSLNNEINDCVPQETCCAKKYNVMIDRAQKYISRLIQPVFNFNIIKPTIEVCMSCQVYETYPVIKYRDCLKNITRLMNKNGFSLNNFSQYLNQQLPGFIDSLIEIEKIDCFIIYGEYVESFLGLINGYKKINIVVEKDIKIITPSNIWEYDFHVRPSGEEAEFGTRIKSKVPSMKHVNIYTTDNLQATIDSKSSTHFVLKCTLDKTINIIDKVSIIYDTSKYLYRNIKIKTTGSLSDSEDSVSSDEFNNEEYI
ncbi:hypothetical protein SGHV024 [Glossina pallidipes salivary gland hypertrophy virus]|uniref:Uncharacterized protein n=1 Tax=Glossina hytrovirus (isolate Glossina pallidipes/Ethiopia/Seibersdorf/-) TaxID=379529 RepID=B0YLH8_GHVS|nr:hypothetical protein SGHV024 [Glossina pallidipes salivary gland hypertrophy virus]ABQ08797.1 hypothetical protein SGHV024 [Glossina pallidipes salivary gland hypertrophy virus]